MAHIREIRGLVRAVIEAPEEELRVLSASVAAANSGAAAAQS